MKEAWTLEVILAINFKELLLCNRMEGFSEILTRNGKMHKVGLNSGTFKSSK